MPDMNSNLNPKNKTKTKNNLKTWTKNEKTKSKSRIIEYFWLIQNQNKCFFWLASLIRIHDSLLFSFKFNIKIKSKVRITELLIT